MSLEYVVSGTSFIRLANEETISNPETVSKINNMFEKMFRKEETGHTFSMLYNAFCEHSYGEKFQKYASHIDKIHADSGGLQVITVGKAVTPELKQEVYENQAKWADVGMCFDEIPVITDTGRSERNDTTGRKFDRVNFHKYAKQTGENVKNQLEVFTRTGSKCKPFVIMQGNDVDTYLEWADIILKTVPKDQHHLLGGIAMGAAALGTGNLEDVQRAYIASEVPIRDEDGQMNLHILGVGSLRRMLPYLIFQQNGLYENVHLSYDSTTHSRGVETGLYYMLGDVCKKTGKRTYGSGSTVKFGRDRAADDCLDGYTPKQADPGAEYLAVYEDINSLHSLEIDLVTFHEVMNNPASVWGEKYGNTQKWAEVRATFAAASIRNFMIQLNNMVNDKDQLLAYASSIKLFNQYNGLYSVKDRESFSYWYNNPALGKTMKSMPISDVAPNSLEGLFSE